MPPLALAFLLAAATPMPELDRLFAGVDHPDTPGCAVDVRRHGAIIAQRSYGMADLEGSRAIDADTVFEAGSVSKQFVGAAVAVLATRGVLSLDDSVRRWLPKLPPLYAPVTIRMLLNHTSGVRNWDNLAELTGWPEGTRIYDQAWALAAIARQSRLNNRPGAEYLYSNSNYVLAAAVVARASGESFNAFTRRALFAPLGMTRSEWRDDFRRVVRGRAQAYQPDDKGAWKLDMPFGDVAGPGALLTTVGDLQRWNATLDNPRPEARAWTALLAQPGRLLDGTVTQYGLGLELGDVDGRPALSHAGSTASYRSWLGRFPRDGLSVALLCNAGSLNTEDLGPELAALYLPATPKAPSAPVAANAPPRGVAGLYRNAANDAVVTITADGAALRVNGGAPFVAAGGDRLATRDGRRTATIRRGSRGQVTEIVLSRIGNAPARLLAETAPAPALGAFAGRYRSADVDGDQLIAVADGKLVWIDPRGTAQPLSPVYRDGFEAPESSWTLRFTRDGRGRIEGLDGSLTRIRRIHFKRIG